MAESTDANARSLKARERLRKIVCYSAPMISALQATAFAQVDTTDAPPVPKPVPLLDAAALAALGAAVTTIAAYRLMKSRKRKAVTDGGEEQ
jgi:hypothetical protein